MPTQHMGFQRLNDFLNKIRQLMQRRDNRLMFEGLIYSKRYIKGCAGSIAKCNTWESRKEGAILSGYGKKRICSPVFV
jgi:hypothetical protein